MEGMQVTWYALYNYKNNLKALVNVKCIEDSVMIKVPLPVIQYVVENIKHGERLGRFMAEHHVVEMLEYIIERTICIPTNCYTKSEEVYDCPDQSNHAEMSFSQYYCLPTW